MLLFESTSADYTRKLAKELGELLISGDVILLLGDLGSGKTTFAQGLARGLGVASPVTSPTFTLIHEYRDGRLNLFHLDPYRLSGEEDVAGIGFNEYLELQGVMVVEWAERLGGLTPPDHLAIHFRDTGGDNREVQMVPNSDRHILLLRQLAEKIARLNANTGN